jgi:hypothetical protein
MLKRIFVFDETNYSLQLEILNDDEDDKTPAFLGKASAHNQVEC